MTNDGYTYRALSRQKAVQYERKEKDDGTIGEGDGSSVCGWLCGRAAKKVRLALRSWMLKIDDLHI